MNTIKKIFIKKIFKARIIMKFLYISSAFLLLVVSKTAVAHPFMTGNIDIIGNAIVLDDGGTPASATGINWGDLNAWPGDQRLVSSVTGSFSGSSLLSPATLQDFNFAGLPVVPLWSVGGFTFDLTSVNVDIFIKGSVLKLSGLGIISAAGYADTAGAWDYTSQSGLSFSSNTVPEPSIAALIGIGLLGFGFLSRRQNKS